MNKLLLSILSIAVLLPFQNDDDSTRQINPHLVTQFTSAAAKNDRQTRDELFQQIKRVDFEDEKSIIFKERLGNFCLNQSLEDGIFTAHLNPTIDENTVGCHYYEAKADILGLAAKFGDEIFIKKVLSSHRECLTEESLNRALCILLAAQKIDKPLVQSFLDAGAKPKLNVVCNSRCAEHNGKIKLIEMDKILHNRLSESESRICECSIQ